MLDIIFESAPLLYAGVFVFGALIGSFLNVVILRIPPLLEYDWRCQCRDLLEMEAAEEERPPGLVFSRSHCTKCGHGIRAHENIPLVSYLALRGRCSACKARISPRYPIIELLTALLFVITIWHFGPTFQGLTALFLTAVLIALAGIDIDHQLLPDNMTIPLMWAGILISFWSIHIGLATSVIGAIAGYLVLWSIYHLFRLLTGKEGMGYGDFKLLAALGAWMGWQMLPLIVLLSSVVGAVVGLTLMGTGRLKKDKPMPFGPFIAAAGWIALIWGQQIIDSYIRSGGFG
ncbi:MAG: prepilin peptidase [Xanthomonadales bacterium]|nr:A24 family peptidase [Gammaproteobacteria bacterium]MBT8052577.1 A24 family peptidase [Gammaproteobacteria bacterium]NND56664.1 prepilin peptidase [Xanthomonadales bacterium]NNK52394.1 prepilin peptidase [Xanthomonadales bacterium]